MDVWAPTTSAYMRNQTLIFTLMFVHMSHCNEASQVLSESIAQCGYSDCNKQWWRQGYLYSHRWSVSGNCGAWHWVALVTVIQRVSWTLGLLHMSPSNPVQARPSATKQAAYGTYLHWLMQLLTYFFRVLTVNYTRATVLAYKQLEFSCVQCTFISCFLQFYLLVVVLVSAEHTRS